MSKGGFDVMLGIITVIISAVIGVIGALQRNTSGLKRGSVFGLTRTGAVLVALSVIGGITGTWLAINDYMVQLTPIIVSPDKISAYIGELETQTPFEVHNRSNQAAYSVWVKIAPETQKFQSFHLIRLVADDGRGFVPLSAGQLFNSEALMMPLLDSEALMMPVLDKSGQPVVFLVIRSLSAGEKRKFSFHVRSSANVGRGQPVAFAFTVVDHRKEPYWFGVGENTVAFKLQVPEGFTIPRKSLPFFFWMLEKKGTAK